MKKTLTILFLITLTITQAQSWQWGKGGGSSESYFDYRNREQAYSLITDSQKNVYFLSKVGRFDLNIDGNLKDAYGCIAFADIMLSSFACDGSYRWSKVFGGGSTCQVDRITIDAQDNIYASGQLNNNTLSIWCSNPRVENDIEITQSPPNNSLMFLTKFNNLGVMQWFKRPLPNNVSDTVAFGQSDPIDLQTDSQGNSYWLVALPAGSYDNNAFTTTLPYNPANNTSPRYILKYNSNGVFVNKIFLDVQTSPNYHILKFDRNPNNGHFFISSIKTDDSGTATVGGQVVAGAAYIASFNQNGQFLWKTESLPANESVSSINFSHLQFDSQNNIYFGARFATGFNPSNSSSFLGYSNPGVSIPLTLLKINPTGTALIWGNHGQIGLTALSPEIFVKDNEVGLTDRCGGTYTWGNQSTVTNNGNNQGLVPLLARFNATTGACIGLTHIPNNQYSYDTGTTITRDASGDYIIGGEYGARLYAGANTLEPTGGDSDFFIAKYSTTACSPLATNEIAKPQESIIAYPNPATNEFNVSVLETCNYNIYNLAGALVQKGLVAPDQKTINITGLSSGEYQVVLLGQKGVVNQLKVIVK